MPRPFPYPIRVGNDICQVSRIHNILTKHSSQRAHHFLKRILTPEEQIWCKPRLEPLIHYLDRLKKEERQQPKEIEQNLLGNLRSPNRSKENGENPILDSLKQLSDNEDVWKRMRDDVQKVSLFLAGRFAAKEAASKAHISRRLTFHDITISCPELIGGATQAPVAIIKAEKAGDEDQIVPMSISHDGDYATAVCLSCEASPVPPQFDSNSNDNSLPSNNLEPCVESIHSRLASTGFVRKKPSPALGVRFYSTRTDKQLKMSNFLKPEVKKVRKAPHSYKAYEMLAGVRVEKPVKWKFDVTKQAEEPSSKKPKRGRNKQPIGRWKDVPVTKVTDWTEESLLDPKAAEERKQILERRQAKYAGRTQSIYGLPPSKDVKAVNKNRERSLHVRRIPPGTTNADLVDAFKGRYSAIKGYVEEGGDQGFVIFRTAQEARRVHRTIISIGGHDLGTSSGDTIVPDLLRAFGKSIHGRKLYKMVPPEYLEKMSLTPEEIERTWNAETTPDPDPNWMNKLEFWTTDVYHVQRGCENRIGEIDKDLPVGTKKMLSKKKGWSPESPFGMGRGNTRLRLRRISL